MEEQMTDLQLETVLKMVLLIIQDSETKEEAVNKIEKLISDRD